MARISTPINAAELEYTVNGYFSVENTHAAHDRVLDFSAAVTGGLFFVPTVDFLEDPPRPGAETDSRG